MDRKTDLKELANEYFEEGIKAFDNHRLAEAILAMQTAHRLFFKVGDFEHHVKSINWLGVIYAEMGIDDVAINFYIEGMEASIRYNLPHTTILFLNNIGTQYMELHKYDKSLSFFKKAEAEFRLENFNDILIQVTEKNDPSILSRYLIDLAKNFSVFYNENKIICSN